MPERSRAQFKSRTCPCAQAKLSALLQSRTCPCVEVDELVLVGAESDLHGVVHGDAPAGVAVGVVEDVVSVLALVHPGALHARHLVAEVAAGHVERDGVESGEHADVRDDRRVVFRMAVAVRRDVADEADVETRLAVHDGGGVFGHLLVEGLGGLGH